ncbi:unnamed protein product [Rhizoctonia solani]|uniref:Uncharacterized protein n=1 Tax=Rhizoctonia solani TaxID=456999 RepID=A0A8H3BIJ6_9AGAM|nr:unnamed protein product [Rhizoctonia solani]
MPLIATYDNVRGVLGVAHFFAERKVWEYIVSTRFRIVELNHPAGFFPLFIITLTLYQYSTMCWPGYGFYCYSCCPLAHEHSSNLRPSPGQHDTVASEVTDLVGASMAPSS